METFTVCFLVVLIIVLAAREWNNMDFTFDDDEDELSEEHCKGRYQAAFRIDKELSDKKNK